jgi:Ca2+-binding RTX toxin-like protein
LEVVRTALSGLADGPHVFRVQARSAGGSFGPVTTATFTVESRVPDTTITSKPVPNSNSSGATFEFTADEPATFRCSVDGAPLSACTSPLELPDLAEGDHTFEVVATDRAGNVDPTPATWTWRIDTVAPTVIDLTGPTGVTADPDAVLTYQADEPASFQCRLNGSDWATCGSSRSYQDLPDGTYLFEVRATDQAGNIGQPAARTWTVLTDPPETAITAGPDGLVNTTSGTFSFSSPDSPVTFECSLDGAAFSACTSPLTLTGLSQGGHVLSVRAVASGVLADPTPATRTWTVDTVAPSASILTGPSGTVGIGASTFTFSANEPATFECSLDGAPFQSCTTPTGLGALSGGSHTFAVRATDSAGNIGAPTSRTWTVDDVAPVVVITSGPSPVTSSTSAAVGFTVDDPTATAQCRFGVGEWVTCTSPFIRTGLTDGDYMLRVRAQDPAGNVSSEAVRNWRVDTAAPAVTITGGSPEVGNSTTGTATFTVSESPATTQCSIDGGPWVPCTSPVSYPGLTDGDHTISVRAMDAAQNTGPAATRTFTVDTVGPVVTITAGPTGTVVSTNALIAFSSDDVDADAECRIDGGAWAPCTSPVAFANLGNGTHTVDVRATDRAGNTGPTAQRSWVVETLEPETSITSAPPVLTNSADATIEFVSNVPGATFECSLDGAPFSACTSPRTLSGLSDGAHELSVRAVADGLTDPTPAVTVWTVDTIAPSLSVTAAPSGTTTPTKSVFAFETDDPTATTQCRVDDGAWTPCLSGFAPPLSDGVHKVEIRAVDDAGNESPTSTTVWTVDGTLPNVQITSGPTGTVNVRDVSFTFTVDDPAADVECRLDFGAWQPCGSPRSLTGLTDGPHSFDVRATDAAGNVSAEGRAFFIDATGPQVAITAGPSGSTTSSTARFDFTVDDPAALVECSIDGGPWVVCASPLVLADVAEGPHSFAVRATDSNGNVGGPATRSWTVDTTAPVVTITAGPDGEIGTDEAVFEFVTTEPSETRCRLDGGAWSPCTSPVTYADLSTGPHLFEVQAVDAAGTSSAVAQRGFTVVISGQPSIAIDVAPRTLAGAPLEQTGLGDDFRYLTTLRNSGPAAAQDVRVQIPLTSDQRLVGSLPAGCTTAGVHGPVTCSVAAIGAGATRTIELRVEATFSCTRWGSSSSEVITGTSGDDVICGGGGADDIRGLGGNDVVWGYGPRSGPAGPVTVATGASVTYGPGGLSASTAAPATVTIAGSDGSDTITTGSLADTITSEEGDDRITAGGGADLITAGDGNDTVDSGSGDDTIDAGAGTDVVAAVDGADIAQGGPGNDRIDGGTGDDALYGGADRDNLLGQAGADRLFGGTGDDTLDGGADTDLVYGSEGDDIVRGGDGNDTEVNGGDGNDRVYGDLGDDPLLVGALGDDTVDGGGGNDEAFGNDGNDVVLGGIGADRLFGGEGADTVRGGDGDDRVDGDPGDDRLFGEVGNDQVNGDPGNDSMYGGDGDDVVNGFAGDDVIDAGGGSDTASGNDGNDTVQGGAGNDTALGNAGNDIVQGGDGNDLLNGGLDDDTVRGGNGNDRIDGDPGADKLYGDAGNDDLNGDAGNDSMYGGDGDDIMIGFAGDDVPMLGGNGSDYMDGSDGDDYLNGQYGRDVLRGNRGNDEVDGGAAIGSKFFFPGDHWNRVYGDAGPEQGTAGSDICRFGPGSGIEGTTYRDASCELRAPGVVAPGAGWQYGSAPRLDRGRLNPTLYPG